jgi:uncharacterized RDD family membrane protein YckC
MVTHNMVRGDFMRYAGILRRFAALVIDFAILSAIFFPTTRVVKGTWLMTPTDHAWNYGYFITDPLCITFLIAIVLYFVLLEAYFGATLGKRLVGIQVIGTDGDRPGLTKSVIRNVLRAVDSLPAFNALGVVLILTSEDRTRLGDRLAGTRVVYHRSGRSMNSRG